MTITINIAPDVAEQLHAQARAQGQTPEALVTQAIKAAFGSPPDALNDEAEPSLLDLEGLGADLWKGIDAQAYVGALRSEWDHRP